MVKGVATNKRKVFAVDTRLLQALDGLGRDLGLDLNALADEAFRDLLRKHRRPATLIDALRDSVRKVAANDPEPAPGTRSRS